MKRYLDAYEVAHLGAPTAFVFEGVGDVDDSALAAVFDRLCVQHPALGGRVRHDGHGHVLDAQHGHHAVFRPQGTGDYPRDVAADWDITSSLATLTVGRPAPGRVRIALHVDHCAGDGRHMYALCRSLWRHYTDIMTGVKLAVSPSRRLPPPPLAVLAARTGTEHDLSTAIPPIDTALPMLRYRRVLLTERETVTLLETARARHVSAYAMLAAAAAHAQRANTIWAVVDVRGHVDPPVGPTETTNFASAATLKLDPCAGLTRTAMDVRAQVLAAIEAGTPQRNMWDGGAGRSMSEPRGPLDAAIVSNLGVVPEIATPPGISITGFRIWPYGWAQPYPMYMASTYGGQLGVDMVFRADVHSDETADQLATVLLTTLIGSWPNR